MTSVVVVGAFLVGGTIGRGAVRAAIGHVDASRSQWKHQALGDLSLTAPGKFARSALQLPPDARDQVGRLVVSSEQFRSDSKDIGVLVARFTYRDDVLVSLDGAASGAMQRMGETPGITDLVFTTETVEPDVRQTHARFRTAGTQARSELVVIQRGQTLWQIQVMAPDGPRVVQRMRRIIDSVVLRDEE